MPFNVNGIVLSAPTSTTFQIANGATNWLKVDASGRMTREVPIYFQGHLTGQGSNYKAANAVMGAVNYNSGSAWNNSTGVFTCPVAGRYLIGCGAIAVGAAQGTGFAHGYFALIKNGINQVFSHWNSGSVWPSVALSGVLTCAAGDTLSFAINTAPSPAAGTNGFYGGDRHGNFFIGLMK